jgi:hypothetical protein
MKEYRTHFNGLKYLAVLYFNFLSVGSHCLLFLFVVVAWQRFLMRSALTLILITKTANEFAVTPVHIFQIN